MIKTMRPEDAVEAIVRGNVPTVLHADTYEMHRILRSAGYFSDDNDRKAWCCVKAFAYQVVNVGICIQVDRCEWEPGQVVPKMIVLYVERRQRADGGGE